MPSSSSGLGHVVLIHVTGVRLPMRALLWRAGHPWREKQASAVFRRVRLSASGGNPGKSTKSDFTIF